MSFILTLNMLIEWIFHFDLAVFVPVFLMQAGKRRSELCLLTDCSQGIPCGNGFQANPPNKLLVES